MTTYTTKEDGYFAECMPFTIYADGVALVAIVGEGEPLSAPTDGDRANAEMVRKALESADMLETIRAAVRARDDGLNRREVPPTGDDYNALFNIVMGDAATDPMRVAAAPVSIPMNKDQMNEIDLHRDPQGNGWGHTVSFGADENRGWVLECDMENGRVAAAFTAAGDGVIFTLQASGPADGLGTQYSLISMQIEQGVVHWNPTTRTLTINTLGHRAITEPTDPVQTPAAKLEMIAARLRGEWSDPHGDLESDIAAVLRGDTPPARGDRAQQVVLDGR